MKFKDFKQAILFYEDHLRLMGHKMDTGHWQGVSTEGKPDLETKEILDVKFSVPLPGPGMGAENAVGRASIKELQEQIKPNLPWADDHFDERVSRVPSNPGEQYKNWPWWRGQETYTAADLIQEAHDTGFKFTHTYQERYWPKRAGQGFSYETVPLTGFQEDEGRTRQQKLEFNRGVRYDYGDLDDLVALLLKQPYTRQAWLPIFFPEDTGAVHGGRIPCTLGYQFMMRDNKLHLWYIIRSCDLIRHFRDDLYLSARLLLWVLQELQNKELWSARPQAWVDVDPGNFHFHCFSLHYHRGDGHLLEGRR